MIRIYGLIQSSRLFKSLAVAILLTVVTASMDYGIGALCFLLFSFVFNDWTDASKDIIGHPTRAIPSRKITRQEALIFSIILAAIGLIWVATFLREFLLTFILIYFLSIIYSYALKPRIPIIGTFVWSFAISILFVQPLTHDIYVFIAIGGIVYAYELLLDYRDITADKVFCYTPTLANLLGKYTFIVSGLIFIGASILLLQILV